MKEAYPGSRYSFMVKEFTAMPQILNLASAPAPRSGHEREQTRWQAFLFLGKAWAFRARRTLASFKGKAVRRLSKAAAPTATTSTFESRSALYSSEAAVEFTLQAGKVQNLRVAAALLDGLIIPAGEMFSFWKHVGRPVQRRGFVAGRELREGCVIPSIGGGLCQLSNALYDAALKAGCEIVERHAHSRKLPGSMAIANRDATVFWNYVDLRFRPGVRCRLETRLTQRELVVRLHLLEGGSRTDGRSVAGNFARLPFPAKTGFSGGTPLPRFGLAAPPPPLDAEPVESCETCEMTHCFRHAACQKRSAGEITAWLVDAWWPEFDHYLQTRRTAEDWLFVPLDGTRWHVGSYRWKTSGFAKIRQAPWEVLTRSLGSRRLAAQGAERQRAMLRFDEALARRYARALPFSATHLVVSLNLLPFLWRDGVLGGRTFDVLMTRQPLADLQTTLDRAHERHPESRTLRDFRVSPELVAAESAALAEARHWITPHRAIAKLGGERSVLLDWILPAPITAPTPAKGDRTKIAFPASTLGRKGAYEVREVALKLGLSLTLGGAVIEDAHFWAGLDAAPAAGHWLLGARAVVLPAWVEHQPRRLLQAVAAGVPVIASKACGLEGVPGVITIPEGDIAALENALQTVHSE